VQTTNQITVKNITFRHFINLIFVLFSLYLMGDAFYRWDGFSYYAPFSEFLPGVSLALILWSIVSLFAALFLWILFRVFQRIFNLIGVKIGIEHLLLFTFLFILPGALIWKVKKLIWPDAHTTILIKLAVLFLVSGVSALMTWLLRDSAKRWTGIVNERIVPLVWIFSMCLILAIPVVVYHTWSKGADKTVLQEKNRNLIADKTRPNIIMVTFDALAARNMSAYGYNRETTPFISRWSENATVFATAEASCNFTTPSAASLMTGKRVWTHQTYQIEGTRPVRSHIESLPSVLKDNGYFNIALVVNPFASVKVLGMSGSFDIAPPATEFSTSSSLFGWKFGIVDAMLYRVFGDKIRLHNWILRNDFLLSRFLNLISRNVTETEVPPEKAFNKFLNILDDNLPTPFFAWIHLFPPHDPYLHPLPFRGMFNSSAELRTYKKQESLIEESYKYLFQYERLPGEMRPSVGLMRDYYDEAVTYIDREFEDFIHNLDKRNLGNTVIVLTADHGDSFEHGYLTHGGPFLYEQVTHVPLIIKERGQTTGNVVSDLVEQIDIPATILELADIPAPSWMEGRSLIPLMRDERLPERPAFSMNFEGNRSRGHQIKSGSIAVWEGDYKLIHYIERNESLLFNLRRDPDELDNLMKRDKEAARHLLDLIQNNLNTANERIRSRSFE
jgi:arylsulfatase A-like enzyme